MSFQPKKKNTLSESKGGDCNVLQMHVTSLPRPISRQAFDLTGKHVPKMAHRTTHKGVGCLSGGWRYWGNKRQQDSRDF